MKINIKEISEQTGFSPATISNALNNKKGVRKETSQEILRIAKKIGYINEQKFTKIKFITYKKNGLIVEDMPFQHLLIDGFEKECKESGYEMAICYLDRRSDDYEKLVEEIVSDANTPSVILGTEASEEEIQVFKKAKGPILLLEFWHHDMSFNGVFINNEDASRVAVEYLIQKGHQKIGYLKGSFRIQAFLARAEGMHMALNRHHLSLENKYVVSLQPTMEGAYHDMMLHLKKSPQLPTAFFADSDFIALGAMKALGNFHYRIPEDISIIGFGDLPFCEIVSPRLTSLRVPKQEMGRIAVKRIIEMIKEDGTAKTKLQVCPEFIERDSVKNLTIN